MKPISEYNPFAAETVENPFEFYAALREQAPVHEVPGLFFLISRHDDVLEVLRQPLLFSSRSGPSLTPPPPEVLEIVEQGYPQVPTLLTNDPPDHLRYRMRVSRAFAGRRVEVLEPQIRRVAHALIDDFAADGCVELVSRFAVPLPLTFIADQFGVPREDMALFKRWSDDSVAPLGGMLPAERQVECARSVLEFQRYFAKRIEEHRAAPRADMPELINILHQFLVAGNETSTNMIASAMMLLLRNPDQLAAVVADRSLIPNLVEETLRLESPVQGMLRTATDDTELAGVKIPSGSRVMLLYASANRDPHEFPDPDRFDVRRPNARHHLAFGRGEHFCVGAALARKEGVVAFECLLERLAHLRLPAGRNRFTHTPSFLLRGLEQLHIGFDSATA